MVEPAENWGRRIFRHWRFWGMFYLLTLLPALPVALLWTAPMVSWARYPVWRAMLETRTLDFYSDLVQVEPLSSGALLATLAGVILTGLLWIGVRLSWLWLEGGMLVAYATAAPLTFADFWRACRRTFGVFLGLGILGALGVGIILIGTGGFLMLTQTILKLSWGWVILIPLLCLLGAFITWIEVARVSAALTVAENCQTSIGASLRESQRLLQHRALPLIALVIGGLALSMSLAFIQERLEIQLPIPWWLPTLLVQQIGILARMGVRLLRLSAETSLLQELRTTQNE